MTTAVWDGLQEEGRREEGSNREGRGEGVNILQQTYEGISISSWCGILKGRGAGGDGMGGEGGETIRKGGWEELISREWAGRGELFFFREGSAARREGMRGGKEISLQRECSPPIRVLFFFFGNLSEVMCYCRAGHDG